MTSEKSENFDTQKFVIRELRRTFKRHPVYSEALKRAKKSIQVGVHANGNPKFLMHYECADCKRLFKVSSKEKADKVAVDHIKPIVDVADGFIDWNQYVPSLFCSLDNLQILCNYPKDDKNPLWVESCHKRKTRLENEARPKKVKVKKIKKVK